jgi:hypothetical protein
LGARVVIAHPATKQAAQPLKRSGTELLKQKALIVNYPFSRVRQTGQVIWRWQEKQTKKQS